MIAKEHRFKGYNTVTRVRSKALRGSGFSLYSRRSKYQWRAAVVVSKKVHKSAVVRNRIRRRIYETVSLFDKEKRVPKLDLVFIVHDKSVADMDFAELYSSVGNVIAKAKTLPPPPQKSHR